MSADEPGRILVLSSRPDILSAVSRAAEALVPTPEVRGLFGRPLDVEGSDLLLVDVAEPRATTTFLRRRFGDAPALIALVEGTWVERLGSALAGEWNDYLFFPLNVDELGLVWRRHTTPAEAPDLSLDVDETGTIRVSIPSDVRYQRPVVDRLVVACQHLADLDGETGFRLRVALGEAVANAILYGGGDKKGALVRISAVADRDALRVQVTDEGKGFDPDSVPDPTAEDGIERSRGRGLFLLRQLADQVEFNEAGNRVALVFRGSHDPLKRLEPWLRPFVDVTGLAFRLERMTETGAEVLFNAQHQTESSGDEEIETREIWPLGPDGPLRVVYASGPDAAAHASEAALLAGWLRAVVERDDARERLLTRRMRRARVLAELEIARDLQFRLLPDPGDFQDLAAVAARCDPALSLGGDFYYLARLPEGRLGIMLGDVSSHGPSAALIMALTLSAVTLVTGAEQEPARALDAMHGQLLSALESTEMYMTLFYGVLDPSSGKLAYANAGHPYAYRVGDEGIERLAALDPPIGMAPTAGYRQESLDCSGQTILAFTDGLAEMRDPIEDPDSTLRGLIDRGELDPVSMVEALFADLDEEMRLDDRTAVAVRS